MSKTSTTSGVSLSTVFLIVFLTLKLASVAPVASWSWWWIFSPLWIPLVLVLVLAFIAAILD